VLAEEIPEAILVGISYGTDDWQQGNLRSTDFTAPSAEPAAFRQGLTWLFDDD